MKKHTHYDSAEMRTLLQSAIPDAVMASEGTRFDSAEDASVFFARELDHVKAQSYDVEYPELTALHLFPQSSEADPGAETITYYTYDKDRSGEDHRQLQHRPASCGRDRQAQLRQDQEHRRQLRLLRAGDARLPSGRQVPGCPQGRVRPLPDRRPDQQDCVGWR